MRNRKRKEKFYASEKNDPELAGAKNHKYIDGCAINNFYIYVYTGYSYFRQIFRKIDVNFLRN